MIEKVCKYCGSSWKIEKEHIKPKSKGGVTTVNACQACNRSKADKTLLTWLRWLKKNDKYRGQRIRKWQYKKRGNIADIVRKVAKE